MPLPDELHKTWIPHLYGQFERGRPILFTGAGFSLAAKNTNGESIPSYGQLKESIWNLCFPGDLFDPGSNLQDLYDHALLRHQKQLADLLIRSFTVDSSSLPAWYKNYLDLPWQRAYTLNIDDLELAANSAFDLPRELVSVSATNPAAAVHAPSQKRLEFVHMNGTLEDVPEYVTFSVTQYADRARTDPWYIRFTADLVTNPIVFVGTRLEEPPLWQHLILRHSRGGRELRELRHRSYLVTPKLDKAKQALLTEYNVVWIPMDAETFSEEVLRHVRAASNDGFAALSTAAGHDTRGARLSEVSQLATNPAASNEFLMGSEPIWADIQSGRAISREIDETLMTKAKALLGGSGVKGVLIVTGTAGSGKSASLERLALELAINGVRVGWADRLTDTPPSEIRSAMKKPTGPPVLAIDDADLYGSELARLVRDVATNDRNPLLIVAIRSGKIDRALDPVVMEGIPRVEYAMPPLGDSDIPKLLDTLSREKRLGILTGKTRNDQIRAFRDEAGRHLLVAMIKATSGKELKEKAFEELGDLDGISQQIYSVICLASSYRFGLTKDEVLIACRDTSNAALNAATQLETRRIVSTSREGYLIARHRMIADIVVDELKQRGHLQFAISGLALLAAAKVGINLHRSARPWRILKVFINHDFLVQMVGSAFGQNLYGDLQDLLQWDYHFWLQRGSLELEYGDVKLAEHYLATAKSLGEHDYLVQTEWAYLIFRKGIDELGIESPKMVEEATSILTDLIATVGDPYPYHILGSQGLAWSRRGITDSKERERYLRKLTAVLQEGCNKHPTELDLKNLLEDVKREYLGIAVVRP